MPVGCRVAAERVSEFTEQSALADARLTDDHRHTSPAGLQDRQERRETSEFSVAAHHWARQPGEPAAAPQAALPTYDLPGIDGLRLALDADGAAMLGLDHVAQRGVGVGCDQHSTGTSFALDAGSNVDRIAEGGVVLTNPVAGSHHCGSGVHADADLELDLLPAWQPGDVLADGIDHIEPGSDRAFGIVLVGLGRAKERKNSVSLDLGDMAFIPLDGSEHPVQRGLDDRGPVLGVHVLGQRGRTHDIGEQDRDRAPLATLQGESHPIMVRAISSHAVCSVLELAAAIRLVNYLRAMPPEFAR